MALKRTFEREQYSIEEKQALSADAQNCLETGIRAMKR